MALVWHHQIFAPFIYQHDVDNFLVQFQKMSYICPMSEFRSYPKPLPKVKKTFGVQYWRNNREKSAKKQIEKHQSDSQKLHRMFAEIWEERPHISALTGKKLPEFDSQSPKFKTWIALHQHHCFEKAVRKFPELKYEKQWIILVTFDEHSIIHYGSPKQKEEIGYFSFMESLLPRIEKEITDERLKYRMIDFVEKTLETKP